MANGVGFWDAAQKGAKKGVQKGVQERVTNVFSGSSGGNASYQNQTQSKGIGKIVFIVLIFLFFIFLKPIYSECKQSGFCETKIVKPLEPIAEGIKDTFSFVGKQAQQTRDIISGEQQFSWTNAVDKGDKSGIWFDNERTYGITLGETESGVASILGDEFGADVDVVVGKIDESITSLDAQLRCNIGNEDGLIRGIVAQKVSNIKLFGPSKNERTRVHGPYGCVFTKEQSGRIAKRVTQTKSYFSEDIVFNLTYSLEPSISLPVFVLQDKDTYDYYRGRFGEAFKDLGGGSYKEHSKGVNSKIQYNTEVQAVMRIIDQPIYPEEGALFGVQFMNKDLNNVAKLNKFNFTLPKGAMIGKGANIGIEGGGDCEWFREIETDDDKRQYVFVLDDETSKDINRDLNGRAGETRPFLCKLEIDESALRGRTSTLIELGNVEAWLSYDYTISEIIEIGN